jgi:adenosine deaminase CECR1
MRSVLVLRSLLCYETAYKNHFRRILWRFAEDGISYAEIRLAMNYLSTIQSDDGRRQHGHAEMIQMLADVLKEETPKIQASGLTFYGVKFIYAVLRAAPKEAMRWSIDTCIEVKQKFPDLICGEFLRATLS